jgi:hypothetical protein
MRLGLRRTLCVMFAVLLAVAASADSGKGKRFEVTDDCDRADATFPPPGCIAGDGQVTNAEFGAALPFGHPSWRIEPPYVQERRQDEIRVRNTGGRPHTFTEVQRFGNGYVPPLNIPGAFTAPECATGPGVPSPAATATLLQPGEELRVEDLRPGTHNFQCCIHPWMRSVVKIDERGRHDN